MTISRASKSLILLILVVLNYTEAETTFLTKEVQATQCGGTLQGDSDTLTYDTEGLKSGDVCVWTIHLETTKDFRFNFTNLDVNSGDGSCDNGGVRLYSLSNLVPSDNLESYTFCNESQWGNSFYLGETVAVVVLYVGNNNTNPGSGFTLSWTGNAVDSLRTKHLSSFASLPTGEIRYPIIGEYEPRVIATWLVDANLSSTEETLLQINSMDLETCDFPGNPCACDALIVYDISDNGVLQERQRICEDVSSGIDLRVQSRFLFAFFTDFIQQDGKGAGFDSVYYPVRNEPTTTPSTSTVTPGDPIGTECGQVLSGSLSGTIVYKPNDTVRIYERCVFTIRVPESSSISIEILSSDFSTSDSIEILSLEMLNRDLGYNIFEFEYPMYEKNTTVTGSVAVVVFSTSLDDRPRNGFTLSYVGDGVEPSGPSIHETSVDYIGIGNGSVRHPSDESSYYRNYDLSTFLLAPTDSRQQCITPPCYNVAYTSYGLDGSCVCCDRIWVFEYRTPTIPHPRWHLTKTICDDVMSTDYQMENSVVLFVFVADGSVTNRGFNLDYQYIQRN